MPNELKGERDRLLASGFGTWSRSDFSSFAAANAQFGRNSLDRIAAAMDKSLEDVTAYAKVCMRVPLSFCFSVVSSL